MSEYVIYDRQGTVEGNTSATFRESVKKIIKSEENISGDITIEKIGISEISNGKFKIHVKYDLDGKLMEIDLPFENCKDLSACKNAKKALDKINGLDTKKMDLKNLITLFMCMVCESEEERAKTLQQVSNQMGIANLNLALNKRDIDRDAAEKQYSSSKLEALGTIAQSGAQFAAAIVSGGISLKMSKQNAELNSCKEAKASANLQKKLNENNKGLESLDNKESFDKKKLSSFDAGNKKTRQKMINECNDNDTKKALESRKQILEDAESRGFTKLTEENGIIDKDKLGICGKFKVTVKNNDFTADDENGNKLFTKENKSYTSDNFYETDKATGNIKETGFLQRIDSRIGTLSAEISIAENGAKTIQGAIEAGGGIGAGVFKINAAGEKYEADKAKADKEAVDATMNLVNNLWSNFRQDFSAALNRVDKTASILKESIDALLQTNMQISRNI